MAETKTETKKTAQEIKEEKAEKERLKKQQKRLSDFLHDLEAPVKDTKAYNYKYATLPQVLDIVKEACKKHGFYLVQLSKSFFDMGRTTEYMLQTGLFDVESGDQVLADTRPLIYKEDAQFNGSFETYSRRYALLTMLGLSAVDDDGKVTKKAQPKVNKKLQETTLVWKEAVGAGVAENELQEILNSYAQKHNGDTHALTDREYEECIAAFRSLIEQANVDKERSKNIVGVI